MSKKIDLRTKLINLLSKEFGPRNTSQKDSDVQEAFDNAVSYLRERFLALPDPGKTRHNCTNAMNVRLIDDKGMRVEVTDLNLVGVGNAIHQTEEFRKELDEHYQNLISTDDEEVEEDEDGCAVINPADSTLEDL